MAEDRLRERQAIVIIAVLMILCGIGIAVCQAVGFGAYVGAISAGGYSFTWVHGFSIIIPGLIGIFVACACGCCNSRAAYITNAVFDSLGLVALLMPINLLGDLARIFILRGSTGCTESNKPANVFGSNINSARSAIGVLRSSSTQCDLNKIMYDCGVALACMWTFGAILTIVHLVLVCHMARVMRETTPGQIVYTPGQAPVAMQSYPNQD